MFTWFVTALGSAVVFVFPSNMSKEREGMWLDACLGFSAGVMIAASYWSLLAPSIEMAEELEYGAMAFFPAAMGFVLGACVVSLADRLLPVDVDKPHVFLNEKFDEEAKERDLSENQSSSDSSNGLRRRNTGQGKSEKPARNAKEDKNDNLARPGSEKSWRRVLLLVIAMTIHNFPEGLAVGVAFGSVGKSSAATFEKATILALGIGLQNFPEGLAVSLPMHREKRSKFTSFFWGQMSGAVEPIGGIIGAAAVEYAESFLPYGLSFAAGAMIFVVVDSIIPEAQERGNGFFASWGAVVGFVAMMSMDVALG